MSSKFLAFEVQPRKTTRTTDTVFVTNCLNNSFLGRIEWHSPFRKYCFYPAENCIFDATCLVDICTKLVEMTEARKV